MTDWRLVENRREVFHDFYEFHLRHRSHPGGVYYLMPYLAARREWTDEQRLWFAFINGCTQHPVTSLILFDASEGSMDGWTAMAEVFERDYPRFEFDTDRRYHKKSFVETVAWYVSRFGGASVEMWGDAAGCGFAEMWRWARAIPSFGRLSAFSFLECLKVMGVPFDCDTLMLDDLAGSRSHRNGLCILTGRDAFDWHKSNPTFDGSYSPRLLSTLRDEAEVLLDEARNRAQGQPWAGDVGYFTLESTLCTYKSWHRPNRRYPNVYNDMMFDRIRKSERAWPEVDLGVFWSARAKSLPLSLRLELHPTDPGVAPVKQNWYRETGEVVMMECDYPKYASRFAELVRDGAFGVRDDR